MSHILRAALIAATIAAPLAAAATEPQDPPSFGKKFYNVTLAVPRSGFDAKAMAVSFCNTKGYKGAPNYTVAMVNPGLAFYSSISCLGHLFT